MLSVKQEGIKYHFWVFGMTQPGTEPWSPGPLVSTPNFMSVYIYSHPQTDRFRSIRTHQCGYTVSSRSWDRNPFDSNANPKLLTIQPRGDISCEVNFKRSWITITIVYIHPFNGCRDLNSSTKRLDIYIYIHIQRYYCASNERKADIVPFMWIMVQHTFLTFYPVSGY